MGLGEVILSRRKFIKTATAPALAGIVPYRDLMQNTAQPARKVAVFAGHVQKSEYPGRYPENGTGTLSSSGIPEYVFNDNLVQHFRDINPSIDYLAVLANQNIPFQLRQQYAQQLDSEIYIEVHHDSAQGSDIKRLQQGEQTEQKWRELSGFSVIYHPNNQHSHESLRLAQLIADELFQAGFKPNPYHAKDIQGERRPLVDVTRAVYTGREYVLRESSMPAVIVEAGVIVNPFEEKTIGQPETQRRIVESIDKAVQKYFAEQRR